jgi:tetratricopeptide (TPR) repeat protein
MKRIRNAKVSGLILIFIVTSSELIFGQNARSSKTDSLIQQGIEYSIVHDYDKAEAIFQKIIKDNPEHPVGYFFMAATIQSKMMDFETENWEQDFFENIEITIRLAKERQGMQVEANSSFMFYRGSALCYLAFYESRKGQYLDAVRHGLAGISILKKVVVMNPEFYDAYFGIGSYKYWRSQVTKYLNWLPILADEREEGIKLVQQAVENGQFTRFAAMNELIWILMDRNRPEDAYYWAMQGITKFPQSRFFLWGMAKSAYALGKYSEAINYYQQLLFSITSESLNNHYNEFICRVHLAQSFEKLERYNEANEQINILESLTLSPDIESKLKKQRKQLAHLKKNLSLIAEYSQPTESLVAKGSKAKP